MDVDGHRHSLGMMPCHDFIKLCIYLAFVYDSA